MCGFAANLSPSEESRYEDLRMYSSIISYRSPDDEGLRIKMKKAARHRAEHEHTWQNRFDKIFEAMNLQKH